MMKHAFFALLILPILSALSACGGSDHMDSAQKYIEEIKAKPTKSIEPIPQLLPTPTAKYSLTQDRDPFQRIVARNLNQDSAPDIQRKKGVLEIYTLDSLKMVGTVVENGHAYVIISTPDHLFFTATVGDYLGQNFGKITSISPDKIGITETFKVNGDWQKREASLILSTEDENLSTKAAPAAEKK